MSVSVVIPTRGDVDLKPILQSFPEEWEVVVYDNGAGGVYKRVAGNLLARVVTGNGELPDLSVYGRYAAIEYAEHDLIVTQDDDCVVSDPQAIVDAWQREHDAYVPGYHHTSIQWADHHVVCNMPPEFRHDFYEDHALVGFGACFHRDAPMRAVAKFETAIPSLTAMERPFFMRTCDIVFTGLTPRVLVDVPVENLPHAYRYDRMYRQPEHVAERTKMRELVKQASG